MTKEEWARLAPERYAIGRAVHDVQRSLAAWGSSRFWIAVAYYGARSASHGYRTMNPGNSREFAGYAQAIADLMQWGEV